MKVTVKLAHEIQNRLQRVVGYIELGLVKKAKTEALDLAKLVKDQTVITVEDCEACGAQKVLRATLETKRETK